MPDASIPEDVRNAIEQLRPELPSLLGVNYSPFIEKLDFFLSEGNETELWDLFADYPAVHAQLLDKIPKEEDDEVTRGGSLFLDDDPIVALSTHYWCDAGSHTVAGTTVQRNEDNYALCPQHHTISEPSTKGKE